MNNKVDAFDELDASEILSETSPATDSERTATGLDIVDSINRAAFRRRTEFNQSGIRSPSGAAGAGH